MKKASILLLVLTSLFCNAQEVLQYVDVEKETAPTNWGPNRSNFGHLYFQIGFFVSEPEAESSAINYGKSGHYELGYRYKKKIFNFFAAGFDIKYSSLTHYLSKTSSKNLPTTINHDKETIKLHFAGATVYNRINIGKRGDRTGFFIDYGVYGNWCFNSVHKTIDKYATPHTLLHAGKIESKMTRLDYIEPLEYGFTGRIGFNQVAVYARYRYSDHFTEQYPAFMEFPRLILGIEVGMYSMNMAGF